MQTDRLYGDPDLAQFYDIENGWAADLEYCRKLADGCASVLDLGCGTGLFAASLAQLKRDDFHSNPTVGPARAPPRCGSRADGQSKSHRAVGDRRLVGVDPAQPMLDIAAKRPGGERVQWIRGDARNVRLDRRFDLVVLTGHAFQVFLTEQDQAAVLRTIADHLAPRGRFIFDSRNPAVEEWKKWSEAKSKRHIEHPALGRILAWNDASRDPATGIVSYETHYKAVANDRLYSSQSKIAFPAHEQLSSLIDRAGLAVEAWLGDWSGAPYAPTTAEIIPVGRLPVQDH